VHSILSTKATASWARIGIVVVVEIVAWSLAENTGGGDMGAAVVEKERKGDAGDGSAASKRPAKNRPRARDAPGSGADALEGSSATRQGGRAARSEAGADGTIPPLLATGADAGTIPPSLARERLLRRKNDASRADARRPTGTSSSHPTTTRPGGSSSGSSSASGPSFESRSRGESSGSAPERMPSDEIGGEPLEDTSRRNAAATRRASSASSSPGAVSEVRARTSSVATRWASMIQFLSVPPKHAGMSTERSWLMLQGPMPTPPAVEGPGKDSARDDRLGCLD